MRNEYTSESCKKANMHTARCTSPLRTVFVATLQVWGVQRLARETTERIGLSEARCRAWWSRDMTRGRRRTVSPVHQVLHDRWAGVAVVTEVADCSLRRHRDHSVMPLPLFQLRLLPQPRARWSKQRRRRRCRCRRRWRWRWRWKAAAAAKLTLSDHTTVCVHLSNLYNIRLWDTELTNRNFCKAKTKVIWQEAESFFLST